MATRRIMTIGVAVAPLATTVRAGDATVLSASRVKASSGWFFRAMVSAGRETPRGFQRPLRGGYSSPEHGSSGPVSRRGVDDPRVLGNSLEQKHRPPVRDPPWARTGSTSDATSRSGAAGGVELCGPAGDLRTEPELYATVSEIDNRPWHVVVAPLVLADCVAMSEVQDVSDALRIDEIVDRHSFGHGI